MTKKQKSILIVVVIVIAVGISLAVYLTWPSDPVEIEEEVIIQPTIPDAMQAGEVGEIEEGKILEEVNPEVVTNPLRLLDSPIPVIIADTKGEIISLGENAITVMGSGENFADQKARELTVKFTKETITFGKGQQVRYVGLEGLRHLEIGQMILISSGENIRGKTEFTAAYINKI